MKSIYTFSLWPYEASHFEKLLSFSIDLFTRQPFRPESSHLGCGSLWWQIKLCGILPWRRWKSAAAGVRAPRCAQSPARSQTHRSNSAASTPSSLNHSHLHSALMNPATSGTPPHTEPESWNDTDREKPTHALWCSGGSYALQPGLKQKGKMKTVHLTAD